MDEKDKTQEAMEALTSLRIAGNEFVTESELLTADKLADLKTVDLTSLEEAFRQIEAALSELQELRMKAIEATYVATPATFEDLEYHLRVYFCCLPGSRNIHALTDLILEKNKAMLLALSEDMTQRMAGINATIKTITDHEKKRKMRLEEKTFKKMIAPLLKKHGREQMLAALEKVHATGEVLERAKKLLGID